MKVLLVVVLLVVAVWAEDMLPSPFGSKLPKSCFNSYPSGSIVHVEGGFVEFPDGSVRTMKRRPECLPERKPRTTGTSGGWRIDTVYNGEAPAQSFNGTWPVPQLPAKNSGQILYLFTGLQPEMGEGRIVIAQPVLQYNGIQSPQGAWALASWFCCDVGYSHPIPINPGDKVFGAMNFNVADNLYHIVSKNMASGEQTVLKVNTTERLSQYYVTLETYNIETCATSYPHGEVPFTELVARDEKAPVNLEWQQQIRQDSCHETVEINGSEEVTIKFGPQ